MRGNQNSILINRLSERLSYLDGSFDERGEVLDMTEDVANDTIMNIKIGDILRFKKGKGIDFRYKGELVTLIGKIDVIIIEDEN